MSCELIVIAGVTWELTIIGRCEVQTYNHREVEDIGSYNHNNMRGRSL